MKKRPSKDNRPVRIMVQDEGKFGTISPIGSSWVPKEMRPKVGKQLTRKHLYVYCAVSPQTGEMSNLVLPYANTEMMNLFLEQVSKDFSGYFVVMQTDQAGWHKSKSLKIPENIRLLFQPAYSPELNPVEHIWDELREKFTKNIVFKSLEQVMSAICKGINQLSSNLERVKSMTCFPHLNVTF